MDVKGKIRKIVPAVKAVAERVDQDKKAALEAAADAFEKALAITLDRVSWAKGAKAGLAALRKALAVADAELSDKQDQLVSDLEELSSRIDGDQDAQSKARNWVVSKMPVFIYLDEYPELHGHQDIARYLERRSQKQPSDADRSFEKLCKVAGLNPEKLQQLFSQNEQETRNQLANRASAVVTAEIKRLWKDRALKIRFNLDAHHLDTS
jgi:hypothetical protein